MLIAFLVFFLSGLFLIFDAVACALKFVLFAFTVIVAAMISFLGIAMLVKIAEFVIKTWFGGKKND